MKLYQPAYEDFKLALTFSPQESGLLEGYMNEAHVSLMNQLNNGSGSGSSPPPPFMKEGNPRGMSPSRSSSRLRTLKKMGTTTFKKRGGIIQEGNEVQKSIEDILKIKKPRSIYHLIRMLYSLSKNFLLSMNAFLLVLFLYLLHHYLIRRRLFKLFLYRALDKLT
jgi:hypothetical protein